MRKTEAELKLQFPSFTFDDIVSVMYGDKPKERRDEKWHDRMLSIAKDNSTILNLMTIDFYTYKITNGYDFYYTLRGDIGVKDGKAFYGSFWVDFGGQRYNIYFTGLPYEYDCLMICHNGEFVTGWRNEHGMHSPSHKIKLLDTDRVKSILSCKDWDDFGTGVQLFKQRITEVFEENTRNYFKIV